MLKLVVFFYFFMCDLFFFIVCIEGFYSLLYKCVIEKRRVRVWIRRYKGLRSILFGYFVVFDKYMNLVRFFLLMIMKYGLKIK